MTTSVEVKVSKSEAKLAVGLDGKLVAKLKKDNNISRNKDVSSKMETGMSLTELVSHLEKNKCSVDCGYKTSITSNVSSEDITTDNFPTLDNENIISGNLPKGALPELSSLFMNKRTNTEYQSFPHQFKKLSISIKTVSDQFTGIIKVLEKTSKKLSGSCVIGNMTIRNKERIYECDISRFNSGGDSDVTGAILIKIRDGKIVEPTNNVVLRVLKVTNIRTKEEGEINPILTNDQDVELYLNSKCDLALNTKLCVIKRKKRVTETAGCETN